MKYIKKECLIEGSDITLRLEDTRDSYVHENALGEIGKIYISREGIMMSANYDADKKLDFLRYKKLTEAFSEIFEATDYNPLSRKYYDKILIMIEDGTLEFLGYEIKRITEDLEETDDFFLQYNESLSELHLPNLKEENFLRNNESLSELHLPNLKEENLGIPRKHKK